MDSKASLETSQVFDTIYAVLEKEWLLDGDFTGINNLEWKQIGGGGRIRIYIARLEPNYYMW